MPEAARLRACAYEPSGPVLQARHAAMLSQPRALSYAMRFGRNRQQGTVAYNCNTMCGAQYLLGGCPAVVGTLWDVTDKDIDRRAAPSLRAARIPERIGTADRSCVSASKHSLSTHSG